MIYELPSSYYPALLPTAIGITTTLLFFLSRLCSLISSSADPTGERLGVDQSNISDEYDEAKADNKKWTVKSLFIYPIKSCEGIELNEVNVVETGFENDRQFMLAEWKQDNKTGEMKWAFMTQRQYPKMAFVSPKVFVDRGSETGGTLMVSFPTSGKPWFSSETTFRVPLDASEKIMSEFPLEVAAVWKDTPQAYNISSLAKPQLSKLGEFLGAKGNVALFRACNFLRREVFRCAPRAEKLGYQPVVGFADAYPLHLLNLASVRDLNSRINEKIPNLSCRRFRANIIINGPNAYDEDDWKIITLGENLYHAACRTTRCLLPNVDPETGVKHPQEPDRSMRAYRRIDEGAKTKACMGMQLVPDKPFGILRVGETVEVHERGSHFSI